MKRMVLDFYTWHGELDKILHENEWFIVHILIVKIRMWAFSFAQNREEI